MSELPSFRVDSKLFGSSALAALADAFQRDGAVCVRGLFSPAEVASISEGVDAVLERPSQASKRASQHGDGLFLEDFCRSADVEQIAAAARNADVSRLAAAVMQSNTARFYHDHVLVKERCTSQQTPWHQDQPYYDVDGSQSVSFWCPVDAVPLRSSLQLVAGSHLLGWRMPRSFKDNAASWFPEGSLPDLPSLPHAGAEAQAAAGAHNILSWAMQPGDAVLFHFLTIHGAGGVDGERRRRVLSLRYVGDDATHAPRAWTTSPAFPGVRLAGGAPLEHPLFPVVWPRGERADPT